MCRLDKRAGRRSAAHRDEPQVGTAVIRQRRVRLAAMPPEITDANRVA
jgi:hypothetical protein